MDCETRGFQRGSAVMGSFSPSKRALSLNAMAMVPCRAPPPFSAAAGGCTCKSRRWVLVSARSQLQRLTSWPCQTRDWHRGWRDGQLRGCQGRLMAWRLGERGRTVPRCMLRGDSASRALGSLLPGEERSDMRVSKGSSGDRPSIRPGLAGLSAGVVSTGRMGRRPAEHCSVRSDTPLDRKAAQTPRIPSRLGVHLPVWTGLSWSLQTAAR